MKKICIALLFISLLFVSIVACGIDNSSQPRQVDSTAPTPQHKDERVSHNRQTVRDWWLYAQEKNNLGRTLQITEYYYDDQMIATKTGFRNIQDSDLTEFWLTELMDLDIMEIEAPEILEEEHPLLELVFQDQKGRDLMFVSLQTSNGDKGRVFINGSFVSPDENFPDHIFLIENSNAKQMFNELKLLIND
jgi:hypothetical protein